MKNNYKIEEKNYLEKIQLIFDCMNKINYINLEIYIPIIRKFIPKGFLFKNLNQDKLDLIFLIINSETYYQNGK